MLDSLLARRRMIVALVTLVFVGLAIVAALELSLVLRHGVPLGPHLVRRLPLLAYIYALWSLRRALTAIGGPASEEVTVARRVGDVGVALFVGGLTQVFAVPTLLHLVAAETTLIYYDVAAITLGAIGFGLLLVARLLEQALRARRELGEFV